MGTTINNTDDFMSAEEIAAWFDETVREIKSQVNNGSVSEGSVDNDASTIASATGIVVKFFSTITDAQGVQMAVSAYLDGIKSKGFSGILSGQIQLIENIDYLIWKYTINGNAKNPFKAMAFKNDYADLGVCTQSIIGSFCSLLAWASIHAKMAIKKLVNKIPEDSVILKNLFAGAYKIISVIAVGINVVFDIAVGVITFAVAVVTKAVVSLVTAVVDVLKKIKNAVVKVYENHKNNNSNTEPTSTEETVSVEPAQA